MTPTSATAPRPGLMIVISAPSGGGKTSLCQRLLNWSPHLMYSVSCTTRAPRPGEQDGREYFFLTQEEFDRRARAGELLEHAVYNGHSYGTPRIYVEQELAAGRDVLLDIEVQGAAQLAEHVRRGVFAYPEALVLIFLMPPSLELLEGRLRGRGTETEDAIRKRLALAEREMAQWRAYDYVILSGRLDDDFERAKSIVIAEKCRAARYPQKGMPWQQDEPCF